MFDVLYGIIFSILCIAGIVYGAISRNGILLIASAVLQLLVIGGWVFFYMNPY